MAIPKTMKRGLTNIRTNSDRIDQVSHSHRCYLRMGALEMEKARRLNERASLLERVQKIEERCHEIETEQEQLLQMVGQLTPGQIRQQLPRPGDFTGAAVSGDSATSGGPPATDTMRRAAPGGVPGAIPEPPAAKDRTHGKRPLDRGGFRIRY